MRKSKNFKNQNRAISERNSIAQIESRKLLDENEKFIFYSIIASLEVHTNNFLEKYQDLLLDSQNKKMERFKNVCLRYLEKLNNYFDDITEEKIKTGMTMYIQLLAHFRSKNYKIEKIEKLQDKYQEEKDLKTYYLELNYAFNILEVILKEGKIKQEWINKYFHYWQIQLRAVANWIEKEINSIDVKTA